HIMFFFIHTSTTEIYTLSLHDALPISGRRLVQPPPQVNLQNIWHEARAAGELREATRDPEGFWKEFADGPVDDAFRIAGQIFAGDRKSTRLNSSHVAISYAVFCLKKKK